MAEDITDPYAEYRQVDGSLEISLIHLSVHEEADGEELNVNLSINNDLLAHLFALSAVDDMENLYEQIALAITVARERAIEAWQAQPKIITIEQARRGF